MLGPFGGGRAIALLLFVGLCGFVLGCGGEATSDSGGSAVVAPRPESGGGSIAPLSMPVDDVILITLDTLRADVLGYSDGEKTARTPAIDRLANEGAVFTQAHAHNVVTLPSHTNILSGRYPYEHGVRANSGFQVPDDLPTAATVLADSGFATGAFVAAYPLDRRYGLNRGFEVYDDSYPKGSEDSELSIAERPGDEVVEAALTWWRSQGDRRRFLWLHLFDAHAPYQPPEPFASQYPDDPYLGEVAALDAYLAPLLEAARTGGNRVLVVLTSDHGESLGDHGEATHGFLTYEPTLRIPLVIWAQGLTASVASEPVRHVDLLPTMLDAAAVQGVPADLPGRSLFTAAQPDTRRSYFEALSPNLNRGWAPLRGMIDGTDKFISLPIPELYDLVEDPGELDNRIREQQARAFDINQLMPVESSWPPERAAADAEEEAMLRSLGYITGTAAAKTEYGPEDDPKNLVFLDQKLHEVIDLFHRQQFAEATRLAEEVRAERPMEIGYTLLSQVLLEQGLNERAVGVMREALSQNLASETLIKQFGLTLAETGQAEEALRLLQPLARDGDPEVLTVIAQVLSEGGDQRQARALLEQLLTIDPGDPVTHERLALVALRSGDWAATRKHAEKALSINPDLSLPWNYLGGAFYNAGRPVEAIDAWKNCVERDRTNFDALFNIAVVAGEVGDRASAEEALARFVAEAPPARYSEDIARARQWLRALRGG